MTKLLAEALLAVQKVSPDQQDALARLILDVLDEGGEAEIPEEHLAAVLEGEAQADRGEFATDEEVAAAFRRFSS